MKIKLKKIGLIFKKLSDVFINYPLVLSLILIIFVILLVITMVYFYFQKHPRLEIAPEVNREIIMINFENYQRILDEWTFRQQRFEKAPLKRYLDPFFEAKEEIQEPFHLPGPLELIEPEQVFEPEQIRQLKEATTLFEFFLIKEKPLPSIKERARIWQNKGLGPIYEYQGFYRQNVKLLEVLQRELE